MRAPRPPGHARSAWAAAALPALAWLGAVLPLSFIPQLEDLLHTLRPLELLPAYGTAWLLLAVLAAAAWSLGVLVLWGLGRVASMRRAAAAAGSALDGVAAAALLAALAYCLLVWLQTFGWHAALRGPLLWVTLAAGFAIGCVGRARALLARLRPLLVAVTAVGAACALTVPLFAWQAGVRSAPPTPSGPAAAGAATAAAPPNLVLLTIDALSAEHMSLYGASRPTTPELAAFARQATTFEHAYADGNFTTPGVASILTGTRPWTNRALQLASWPEALTRRDSLPAVLARHGYRLGYVSTNSAAGADKNGLGRYFQFASRDRITDLELCSDGLSATLRYVCPVAAMPLFGALMGIADALAGPPDNAHYDPRLAIDPALAWLQRAGRSRPIFLWVHLFPPHSPYAAPPPWLGRFDASDFGRSAPQTEPHWGYSLSSVPAARVHTLEARYDESVAYVDHYAGQFLQSALRILGPNTAVVVTADHGESFHHGYGAHTGPRLFNEIIHIPLIVKLPGQTQGISVSQVVEQVDIAPTLAQLAGTDPPSIWEGRSLLPVWSYPQDPLPDKPAFSMNFEQNRRHAPLRVGSVAVIDGQWKFVHFLGHPRYPDMPPLRDTLYDLAADPGETVNLAARDPAEAQRLRALIDAQLRRHGGTH